MTLQRISNLWHVSVRGSIIWIGIILAEVLHGILRAITLVPQVGKFHADQIGVFTGSIIILAIAYLTHPWLGAKRTTDLLTVGALWVVLTLLFEFTLGSIVLGLSWRQLVEGYDVAQGGLMPLGLLLLWSSPVIAKKLRDRGQEST